MDIDWQNNVSGVKDRLGYLLGNEVLTDVKFSFSDGSFLNAHKLVLASASPVFLIMLFGNLAESTDLAIKIEDVESQTFMIMLKYIYTDKVELETWESGLKVYSVAKKYILNELKTFCLDFIIEKVNAENALELNEFAIFHEEKSLEDAALKIIRKDTLLVLKSIFNNSNRFTPDVNTILTIFSQDELEANEVELFDTLEHLASVKGVTKDVENGNLNYTADGPLGLFASFRQAVKNINFLAMSAAEFSNGPAFSKLLSPSESVSIFACLVNPSKILIHYPKDFAQKRTKKYLPRVFFEITVDDLYVGSIVIELRADVVPITVKEFLGFCTGQNTGGFRDSRVHFTPNTRRLRFKARDFLSKNVIEHFTATENFTLSHFKAGTVGLIPNDWKTQRVSEFYITSTPLHKFDKKQVVIGYVAEGLDVIDSLQTYSTESSKLKKRICVQNCGLIERSILEMHSNQQNLNTQK